MNQPYSLGDFAKYIPPHDGHFNQNAYITALLHGYSDEEAYQIASAQLDYSSNFTKLHYQYPDPDQFSDSMHEDFERGQEDLPKSDSQEGYLALRDDWKLAVEKLSTNPTGSDPKVKNSIECIGEGRATSIQERYYRIDQDAPATPELVASSPVTAGSSSSRVTPDTSVSPSAPSIALPDTYAGRRSAQGRSNFPRECGACGKRFLYEDSAFKHYRKHHGDPPDIIMRWDAPKRPPPGFPRNVKAALSRARQSLTPPGMVTTTSSTQESNHVGPPNLPSTLRDQIPHTPSRNVNNTAGSPPEMFLETTSRNMTESFRHFETEYVDTGALPQNPIPQVLIHPNSGLAYSDIYNWYHNSTDELLRPTSSAELNFSPHDARYAAMQTRRMPSNVLPQKAQEAISLLNPHLTQKRLEGSEPADEIPIVHTEQEYSENIRHLKNKASSGQNPPLPPDWAYDRSDASFTFHSQYGNYYKRGLNGKWQRWCADINCWQEG